MRPQQVLIPLVRQIINRPFLANAMGKLDPWGNPFTDEFLDDPMVLGEAIRKSGPVYWHPLYQQWFITGYDEAREVLASPHVGTAEQMNILLDVSPYTKLSERSRDVLRNLMLLTDPPKHTRLRGLVNRAFTPKQVSRLEPMMASMVDDLVAEFGDEVELMTDFAVAFPAMVIGELFGFDRSDWEWLRDLSAQLTMVTDPIRGFEPADVDRAVEVLGDRVIEMAADRRENPKDDLLTGLALAEADDGDRLSQDELVSVSALILIAGHETTSGMIGLSVLMLSEHRDQLELLRAKPELWPNGVDELLRFDPTLRTDPRSALADFELGGKKIKKGQVIAVLAQNANRDLRRFADADEFRVDRDDPNPISFGHGIHFCLGANLARAELRTALPPLMDALDDYEIDRTRIEWRQSISLRGPASFPMRKKTPAS